MDEIVKQVVERTGMPEDQVRGVVVVVIEEIKKRLPEPIAAQVDGVLASGSGDVIGQAGQMLGGLFGKQG